VGRRPVGANARRRRNSATLGPSRSGTSGCPTGNMTQDRIQHGPRVGFVSLGCPKATVDSEHILTRCVPKAMTYRATMPMPISGRRQYLRFHRRGRRGVARRDRRGAGRERQGDRDRLPGAQAERGHLSASAGARRYRAACDRRGDACGASHLPKPHDPSATWCPPQGVRLTPRHYAYLKISEGCNHRCTFCIIPSMRGDLVSRPIGEVMREAESLVDAGVKEILVISQDTSAYGVDVKYRTGFWNGRPVDASARTGAGAG
jgi:ribosomal protein S12 methylthiotransferase